MPNPTPPPTDLPTLKTNAYEALVCNAPLTESWVTNSIRAYLDALERENERLNTKISQLIKNTPACPACAECFWTGSVSSEHTCGIPSVKVLVTELERGCQEPCVSSELNELYRAVAGIAAEQEHNARVYQQQGLHGEQLERAQNYAKLLRAAANHLKAQPTLMWLEPKNMKPAEEWTRDFWRRDFNGPTPVVDLCFTNLFREVQQDAIASTKPALTFSDALRIARGCLDEPYSGANHFYIGHGIQTVINALEAAEKEHK